ncbi:hypothetical protein CASFOL_010286 [Castilleja foliolosa]|uniref:Scarecrow-like protein 9 n=1 Tax=Castilleja foliolosa TaxID=1961234 RepID=A0ABD3DTN1_9LAMI
MEKRRIEMDTIGNLQPNVFELENAVMDEFQMLINGKTFEDEGPRLLLENLQPAPIDQNDNYLQDEGDFSDEIFRYISEMLMDEEMEEQTYMLQESLELQAKERSFYELLCQRSSTDYDDSLYTTEANLAKKNQHTYENDCEEQPSKKLAAIYPESNVPIEEFDDVLLYTVGEREKIFESYITDLKKIRRKSRRKSGPIERKRGKEEFIDFRSLLMNCAKSVAAGDNLAANNLINQIREHSSPFGDGDQRLAHYFANGLEARMAGTGSDIYKALVCRTTFASDYLKAYYTYLASSPFINLANFVANKCIVIKSEKAMRLHIIDFGVLYGFQWPSFIQSLAEREGGPPKLRITGIDFPQPGFRPAERIEESGRRLARYAQKFNVPFEFNAIAKKWETVRIEDLKMEKDEFVAVNCLYRAENLRDEEGLNECSRTMVLKLIRKISPDIFIHEVVNASYGLPFFVTRFREALYHFYALFDMLDANVPRENPERILLERDLFGQEALNVIACEGWERVERAETYKQWQRRHMNAGFMQIPFDRGLIDTAIYKVRKFYHRDFSVNEENKWLFMGWKGRVVYAISCLQPV